MVQARKTLLPSSRIDFRKEVVARISSRGLSGVGLGMPVHQLIVLLKTCVVLTPCTIRLPTTCLRVPYILYPE